MLCTAIPQTDAGQGLERRGGRGGGRGGGRRERGEGRRRREREVVRWLSMGDTLAFISWSVGFGKGRLQRHQVQAECDDTTRPRQQR